MFEILVRITGTSVVLPEYVSEIVCRMDRGPISQTASMISRFTPLNVAMSDCCDVRVFECLDKAAVNWVVTREI
jgi:hypothetical protein